jgi:hypothetical protein
MTLPQIKHNITRGRQNTHAYMDDDPAIVGGAFGATDSLYIVCSKKLAVAIYGQNPSYDAVLLKRGLKDGWLKLIINPDLFESLSNPLASIRAIKAEEAIGTGWYKLLIIPEWGSRR